MQILIAPDKFKGTLTANEVCESIKNGISQSSHSYPCTLFPLADGGEGTVEVFLHHLKGNIVTCQTVDPLNRNIQASYGISRSGETAFIEISSASGLRLLRPEEYDILNTTTRGTGILILDAIQRGVKRIILGVGGSATNDAAMGAATILGYHFLNNLGEEIDAIGKNLIHVASIDVRDKMERLDDITMETICDVTNPFSGPNGAAYIYGPQKGATPDQVRWLDAGLEHFASILKSDLGCRINNLPGAGAGGGFAGGAVALFNATLRSGVDVILEATGFEKELELSDIIITGEGKLDNQTLQGKVISGVCTLAAKYRKPVVCIVGKNELSVEVTRKMGIQKVFSLSELFGEQLSMQNPITCLRELGQHSLSDWLAVNNQ